MDSQNFNEATALDISWEHLHRDARLLSRKLLKKGPFKGIIAVARGGLVPAGIVARELNLRLIDTFCIASYDDRVQGKATVLKTIEGDGEGWLVIDDLVDSGITFKVLRERLPKAHYATVYAKPKGRPMVDTTVVEIEQHMWLVFPWDADEPLVKGG